MKNILLLLLFFPIFGKAQVVYDPSDNLVKMSLSHAAKLDSLARLGKECSVSIEEAQTLLVDLENNREYNTKMVESLQTSIMFAKNNLSLLEKEIQDLQIENAMLSRNMTIYKNERDHYEKKARQDMWGKITVSGVIISVAAAVTINSLTRR